MKLCIGITVEPDIAKLLIKELVEQYKLTLITDNPILILPDDDRAMFFCETDDQETLDMLDIDEAIDVVWYEFELHSSLEDAPLSGNKDMVKRLEALLSKDADPNGQEI